MDKDDRRNKKAPLYSLLLFMVFIWGANFIISKFVLFHFPPLTIASTRVFFSATAFLIFRLFIRDRVRILLPDHLRIVILAFFGIILNQLLFIFGLNYTSPGHCALMIATIPLFVYLFEGRTLQESLRSIKGAGILISFSGVIILMRIWELDFRHSYLLGDLLALLTSISFAIYTVLGKPIVHKYSPLKVTAFVYFYGALMMIPLYPCHMVRILDFEAPISAYLGLSYIVFLVTFVAYIIYYWALSRIEASKVAALLYLQPLIATLLSILLGFESFSLPLLSGGILIVGGVAMTERG